MSDETQIEEVQASEVPTEKEPSSFKLISSLGIAGFFAGLALVGIYLFTKPMIEANKAEALRKAIYLVLPECDSFKTFELDGETLKMLAEPKEGEEKKEKKDGAETAKIYGGYTADGTFIGFAIPAAEPGFQDIIGAIYGYDVDKKMIIGFEVLESKETPGLGDKIFKDEEFTSIFKSLQVEPEIVAVKKGKSQNPNEVETITGATISSKAVVRLLNKAMEKWRAPMDNYISNNSEAK